MTFAHLAAGSIASDVLHIPAWIDGAILFIMLSGLVLGIVQRSITDRTGTPNYLSLVRRALFLYVTYALILILALTIREFSAEPARLRAASDVGGWANAIFLTLTLQIPAPNLTILPMYVVLLLVTIGTAWLVSHRQVWVAAAGVFAIWLVGTLAPQWTVMPYITQSGATRFNWATWLLPFTLAFLIGWVWRQYDLSARIVRPAVVAAAVVVCVVCFGGLMAITRLGFGGEAGMWVLAAFSKWDLGIGVIVFGAAATVVLYAIFRWLNEHGLFTWLTGWLSTVGSFSLDSFVILCLAVVIVPAVAPYEPASIVGMLVAVVALIAMTLWAAARRRDLIPLVKSKSHQLAAEPSV